MRKEDDPNYISVGAWVGMMIVTAVPLLGTVMVVLWSFVGDNQSRKNYYRAVLLWLFVLFAIGTILNQFFALWPVIHREISQIQQWAQSHHGPQKH